jgi:hypothetical protein
VRPELDLWVAHTPGGCQISYMDHTARHVKIGALTCKAKKRDEEGQPPHQRVVDAHRAELVLDDRDDLAMVALEDVVHQGGLASAQETRDDLLVVGRHVFVFGCGRVVDVWTFCEMRGDDAVVEGREICVVSGLALRRRFTRAKGTAAARSQPPCLRGSGVGCPWVPPSKKKMEETERVRRRHTPIRRSRGTGAVEKGAPGGGGAARVPIVTAWWYAPSRVSCLNQRRPLCVCVGVRGGVGGEGDGRRKDSRHLISVPRVAVNSDVRQKRTDCRANPFFFSLFAKNKTKSNSLPTHTLKHKYIPRLFTASVAANKRALSARVTSVSPSRSAVAKAPQKRTHPLSP